MIPTLLRATLATAVFTAAFAALALSLGGHAADTVGLSLPFAAGAWLLVLGAWLGRRRGAILAVAVVAGLLFVLQVAVFAVVILLSGYNESERSKYQVLLGLVLVAGPASIAWLVRSKRERWHPDPPADAPRAP